MKKIIISFTTLIVIIGLLSGWSSGRDANNNEDVRQILQLSNQVIQGDKKVILNYQGPYKSYKDQNLFKQIGMQLRERLELPQDMKMNMSDQQPICTENYSQQDGTVVSVSLVGGNNNRSMVIISLKTSHMTSMSSIEKWMADTEKKLKGLGIKANWTINVQGALKTSPDDQHKQLWNLLSSELQAQEMERYEDDGTLSISFFSPKLRASLNSGNHTINLQAAVHQNSVTNEWRVTLGTPIITIEY